MGKSFWTSQRSSWRAWVTCYESCRLTHRPLSRNFSHEHEKKPSRCFVFFFQLQSIDFQQSHISVDVGRSGDNIELVFFFCLSCSNEATLAIFLRSSYFICERGTLFFSEGSSWDSCRWIDEEHISLRRAAYEMKFYLFLHPPMSVWANSRESSSERWRRWNSNFRVHFWSVFFVLETFSISYIHQILSKINWCDYKITSSHFHALCRIPYL